MSDTQKSWSLGFCQICLRDNVEITEVKIPKQKVLEICKKCLKDMCELYEGSE